MASITERQGRFLVRVRKDGFRPLSQTFTKRSDGAAWGRRVEADMEAGRWRDPGAEVPTLAAAITQYRAGRGGNLKGSGTYSYWLTELSKSWLGALPLNDITPAHLSKWRDEQMVAGLKPGTVVRKLGMLSGLLTWCVKDRGWIEANPLGRVSKPRVNDARDRTLSDSEMDYVRRAASSSRAPWIADALIVAVSSAMRRGEIWSLRARDIDFAASTAHLSETKNGSARDVPLCTMAREALSRLVTAARARAEAERHRREAAYADAGARERRAAADSVNDFADQRLIPVGDPSAMSLAFRRTLARARRHYWGECEKAGTAVDRTFLADLRLHDLRHQAVSKWAATGGLSMMELMAVSGHKSPRMLARYTHLNASSIATKMSALATA